MSGIQRLLGRIKLQLQGNNHIVGWNMTPDEAVSFIRQRGKTVLTFFGYSGMGYEDEHALLQTARHVLQKPWDSKLRESLHRWHWSLAD